MEALLETSLRRIFFLTPNVKTDVSQPRRNTYQYWHILPRWLHHAYLGSCTSAIYLCALNSFKVSDLTCWFLHLVLSLCLSLYRFAPFSPWSLNTVILWAHLSRICICIIYRTTTYQNIGAEDDLCQHKRSDRYHITAQSLSQTQFTRGLLVGEEGEEMQMLSFQPTCMCECD